MTKRQKQYVASTLASLVLLSLLLFSRLTCEAATPTETRAASVLFKLNETVVYTKTDFLVRASAFDLNIPDSEMNLRLPFVYLLGGLNALGPNALSDLAKSYRSILVGAKDFGAADVANSKTGLGLIDFHYCYIGILEGSAEPNIETDFRKASFESIEGRQVWTWTVPPSGEEIYPTKFYAAQIAGVYFVMTSNLQDLKETVNALISAGTSDPLSIGIAGWESFSTYNYWAYRLIRQSGVISADAEIRELIPDVVSLMFYADVDKRESLIQVVSTDKSMKSRPKVLPASELNLLQPLEPGIWQAKIPLTRDEAGFDALFQVLCCFRFCAAL